MTDIGYNYAKKFYDAIDKRVEESSFFTGILEGVEKSTGIQGPFIVTGVTLTFLLFVISAYGFLALADAIVILYPAYRSFQALESDNEAHVSCWTKYWVLLAFFRALEHPLNALFSWMPGYILLKFLFLVFCFLPVANNGAVIIYENYIEPTFIYNVETAYLVFGRAKEVKRTQGYY